MHAPHAHDGEGGPTDAHATARAAVARPRGDRLEDRPLELVPRALAALHAQRERGEALVRGPTDARPAPRPEQPTPSAPADDVVRDAVRRSVVALAHRLRADAVPPERMLVLVKSAVERTVPPGLDLLARRALVADAVRWSVAAYYAA
jgi:hypothetical protein